MEIINSIIKQWKAETPTWARIIRNTFAALSVAVPVAYGSLSASNIQMPEIFSQYVGYIIFVSVLVTAIAGTKEKKGHKK